MERDPLMLNQRLMLMLTMDTTDMPDLMPMDTDPMDTHTDTDTMARDLLMPSPRLRLTQLCSTPPAPWSTLSTTPLSTPQLARLLPPPQLSTTLPSTTQLSTTLLSTPPLSTLSTTPSHSPTPWSTLFQLPPPLSPRERLRLTPPWSTPLA